MSVSAPVPDDHPLMVAWNAYKGTDDFANTRKWAAFDEHLDGSLWAAFEQGFRAAADLSSASTRPADVSMDGGNADRSAGERKEETE